MSLCLCVRASGGRPEDRTNCLESVTGICEPLQPVNTCAGSRTEALQKSTKVESSFQVHLWIYVLLLIFRAKRY